MLSLSPYQRAKASREHDEPLLRPDILHGQRLLNQLRVEERQNNDRGAGIAEQNFLEFLSRAFPEAAHDLAQDVHALCDWSALQNEPSKRISRVAILFAGTLINHKDVATAVPLLSKALPLTEGDPALKSLCSLNQAVAISSISEPHCWHHWQLALDALPPSQWPQNRGLLAGCGHLIRHLRNDYVEGGDFGQILLAGAYAESGFEAVSQRWLKGTSIECSPEVITLLVEIARTRKAVIHAGLKPLNTPESSELFKLAAINAATNTAEPELFVRSLMYLAQHHLEEGEREEAKDAAAQALLEFTQLPKPDPQLGRTLQFILTAALSDDSAEES